jgi:hypothetical protein
MEKLMNETKKTILTTIAALLLLAETTYGQQKYRFVVN